MAVRAQDTESLGGRIARLRREKGLTQAEAGARAAQGNTGFMHW
jgi:hypothetical protein